MVSVMWVITACGRVKSASFLPLRAKNDASDLTGPNVTPIPVPMCPMFGMPWGALGLSLAPFGPPWGPFWLLS